MNAVLPQLYAPHDVYFRTHSPATPCLLVDLDVVAERYAQLRTALPEAEVFYAVKANSERELLELLVAQGCSFDVASRGEVDLCLEVGADPARLSYGNTVKKVADVEHAYERGVRTFTFDSESEMERLAKAAPGAQIVCRITVHTTGAQWPLSRKFGCAADDAVRWLSHAVDLGLAPFGLVFHVGSQQRNPTSWVTGVELAADIWRRCAEQGVDLTVLNVGGGLPASYDDGLPPLQEYADTILRSVGRSFPRPPALAVEPGRYLTGDAGLLRSEVVGVMPRDEPVGVRWAVVDVGRFGGLAETEGEAIRYPLVARRDGEPLAGPHEPTVLAGPTCDSADILYERAPRQLPADLQAGDHVDFLAAGAYTSTYSSVGFNGFPPLAVHTFRGSALGS